MATRTINNFIRSGSGGSGGGTGGGVVMWFASASARDAYFYSNPQQVRKYLTVGVGDPVDAEIYTGDSSPAAYDSSKWATGAVAFKGDKGDKGNTGNTLTASVVTDTDTTYVIKITETDWAGNVVSTLVSVNLKGGIGPRGNTGNSVSAAVKTSTADTYILTITTKNGSGSIVEQYDTPNLIGVDGTDGTSVNVLVKTQTASEYVLTINRVNSDGTVISTFDTPNLNGGKGDTGDTGNSVDVSVNSNTQSEYTLKLDETQPDGTVVSSIITPNLKGDKGQDSSSLWPRGLWMANTNYYASNPSSTPANMRDGVIGSNGNMYGAIADSINIDPVIDTDNPQHLGSFWGLFVTRGADGESGNSVDVSVLQNTSTTYTLQFKLTDGETGQSTTFDTPNLKGASGNTIQIAVKSSTATEYILTVTVRDSAGTVVSQFDTPNMLGAAGTDGTDGANGNSSKIIEKLNTGDQYVLTVQLFDGLGNLISSFDTPNLKGGGGGGGVSSWDQLTGALSNGQQVPSTTMEGNTIGILKISNTDVVEVGSNLLQTNIRSVGRPHVVSTNVDEQLAYVSDISAIPVFTNAAQGELIGDSSTPGYIAADVDPVSSVATGKGKVNGWETKANIYTFTTTEQTMPLSTMPALTPMYELRFDTTQEPSTGDDGFGDIESEDLSGVNYRLVWDGTTYSLMDNQKATTIQLFYSTALPAGNRWVVSSYTFAAGEERLISTINVKDRTIGAWALTTAVTQVAGTTNVDPEFNYKKELADVIALRNKINAEIVELEDRIAALSGSVAYLKANDFGQPPDDNNDPTWQQSLTSYALQQHPEWETVPNSVAVKNLYNNHIWIYSSDTHLWTDNGQGNVSAFTNQLSGIIKGNDSTPGYVKAVSITGGDTEGEVNGWADKQDLLVSGTNIMTLNGSSILGAGDLKLQGYTVWTVNTIGDISANAEKTISIATRYKAPTFAVSTEAMSVGDFVYDYTTSASGVVKSTDGTSTATIRATNGSSHW